MSAFTFTVYGTEFCRLLEATALFQAKPKDYDAYAAVRCFVRHDGLTMVATNLFALAVGTISTAEQNGTGILTLPAAQVRVVLAMFKRRLPKEVSEHEYVLEVQVEPHAIRIREISGLFDNDQLVIATLTDQDLQHGETSDDDRAMALAAYAHRMLADSEPFVLEAGCSIAGPQLALMCRAARALAAPFYLRTLGRRLVGIVADGDGHALVMVVGVSTRDKDAEGTPIDTEVLAEYRGRLDELVDQAVL